MTQWIFPPKLLDFKSSLAHDMFASPTASPPSQPFLVRSQEPGLLWMNHAVLPPLLPSFTSLISDDEAYGDSEAPYPTQRYILAEKIKVDFLKKEVKRWLSPFLPGRNSIDNLLASSSSTCGLQLKGKYLWKETVKEPGRGARLPLRAWQTLPDWEPSMMPPWRRTDCSETIPLLIGTDWVRMSPIDVGMQEETWT